MVDVPSVDPPFVLKPRRIVLRRHSYVALKVRFVPQRKGTVSQIISLLSSSEDGDESCNVTLIGQGL